MTLEFLDCAQAEFDDAAAYYDEKQQGLGGEFRDEVMRATERILIDPTSFSRYSPNTRLCQTRRFPYGILFQVQGECVRIVAVAHLHRDPDYWIDRIQD